MNSKIKYIAASILLIVNASAFCQVELNSYLKVAGSNNPGLKSSFNQYLSALEKVPQVGSLPDPTFTFAYFIEPIETRVGPQQARFSLKQMFPWFGTLGAQKDVSTEIAKIKYEAFEDAKSKLYYDVKSTYFNLYALHKSIEITDRNIDILTMLNELAGVKFEAGLASAVDIFRVEMELADLTNQKHYLLDHHKALSIKFNNLLDTMENAAISTPDTLWLDNLNYDASSIKDSILSQNHVLKQLEHRIMSWERQETVARRTGRPNFSVGVDYISIGSSANPLLEQSENGKDAIVFPTISFSIPLYRKKYNSMIREASINIEGVTYEKEEKQNELITLFELIYKDYKDADRRIALYENQSQLAEKSLDILIAEYSTTGKNFEEVLRMEKKALMYSLEQDKARADKSSAKSFIIYLTGK